MKSKSNLKQIVRNGSKKIDVSNLTEEEVAKFSFQLSQTGDQPASN